MSSSATHPTRERLAAFTQGRLSAQERAEIERHVADCDSCCRKLGRAPAAREQPIISQTLPGVPAQVGDTLDLRAGDPRKDGANSPKDLELPPELLQHPRYRIFRRLGQGGMGVVYQAEHRMMQRPVALKVIHNDLTQNTMSVQRFLLEVKAAGRLAHPNIVTAHDAEQLALADGSVLHLLVMEYVEGINLARLLEQKGPLPVDQACYFIRQAALGLQHAHQHGMVHRDIKPHNLMVTRKGQIKVLDFGLARLTEPDRGGNAGENAVDNALTAVGIVLGTPDYMAPEQVGNSHEVDIRADIYSLGCTFYFLLTGRPPYPEGSPLDKVLSHATRVPLRLTAVRPELPAVLDDIILRMMARDPSQRYQTPDEVARVLAPFTARSQKQAEMSLVTSGPASSSKMPRSVPASPDVPTEESALDDLPEVPSSATRVSSPPRSSRTLSRAKTSAADDPTDPGSTKKRTRRANSDSRSASRTRSRPGDSRRVVLIAVVVGQAFLVILLVVALLLRFVPKPSPPPADGSPKGLVAQTPPDGFPKGVARNIPTRVLVVVSPNGFDPDAAEVRAALEQGGAQVKFAKAKPPPPKGEFRPAKPPGDMDLGIHEAMPEDFDAIVFVSERDYVGNRPPANDARRLIQGMLAAKKVVAGIGSGIGVLAEAGVLEDKEVVILDPSTMEALRGKRVIPVDRDFVQSGQIITGRGMDRANAFGRSLLNALRRGPQSTK